MDKIRADLCNIWEERLNQVAKKHWIRQLEVCDRAKPSKPARGPVGEKFIRPRICLKKAELKELEQENQSVLGNLPGPEGVVGGRQNCSDCEMKKDREKTGEGEKNKQTRRTRTDRTRTAKREHTVWPSSLLLCKRTMWLVWEEKPTSWTLSPLVCLSLEALVS